MSERDTASLQTLMSRAEQAAAGKDFEGSAALYQQVLQQHPGHAQALLQLSYVQSLSGQYRMARDSALAACAARPTSAEVVREVLARLRTFNEIPTLRQYIGRLGPLTQLPIPLLIGIAAHLVHVNLPDEALPYLDEARRGDPDYPVTLQARGQLLTYLGRLDEAEAELKRALRIAPEFAQSAWLLSFLRKATPQDNRVQALQHELKRPGRNTGDLALLGFSLHKELDDLGRHDEAWRALIGACQAKRSGLRYAPHETERLIDALCAFEVGSGMPYCSAKNEQPTPIFITGMHRSGTTLLEQLLSASPSTKAIGELYDFTSAMRFETDYHCRGVIDQELVRRAVHAALPAAGQRYIDGLAWRLQGKRFFTDKLPSNFLNIGFIARALPQARILHMVRDPVETCFSNLRELFSEANPYSYDQQELAHFHRHYRRLMRHWHASHPGRILDVDYARLVREPEAVLREVCTFCGLDFTPAMLELSERKRGVVTASAVQVRGGIQSRQTPKWAPYAAQLQPLIQALAED